MRRQGIVWARNLMVYRYCKDYLGVHAVCPTVKEVGRAFGLSDRATREAMLAIKRAPCFGGRLLDNAEERRRLKDRFQKSIEYSPLDVYMTANKKMEIQE